MSLSVQVAGKSDLGCVRQNNEDNFGYDARFGIFVVCDGMGGAAAGEVASKTSVDTVLKYFRDAARSHRYPVVGQTFEGVSERANALASAIQLLTGYFTETNRKPVKEIGESSQTGAATVILSGVATGMESAVYAALLIGGAA